MHIGCWFGGGKNLDFVETNILRYQKMIRAWHDVSWEVYPDAQGQKEKQQTIWKKRMDSLRVGDFLVLLDEGGSMCTSENFSERLLTWTVRYKRIIFLIGGAYGLPECCYKRTNYIWSLSLLTYPHQLVRLLLFEQLYRSYAILHHKPYHHS